MSKLDKLKTKYTEAQENYEVLYDEWKEAQRLLIQAGDFVSTAISDYLKEKEGE